jgi:ribose transport system permease protein
MERTREDPLTSVQGGPSVRAVRPRGNGARLVERFGLLIAWAIVILAFGILKPDTFLTQSNFATMLGSQAVLVVLALALLIPLTAGDYDLSVASVLSLAAMMVGVLNAQNHVPIGLVILAALAMGVVVGAVNGFFVIVFGIDPLIVTLGIGTVLSGIVLWISNSMTISGISQSLVNVVVGYSFLGIPLEFYYGLALTIVLWYVFEYTSLGRRMLFVGRGRSVARLSGIRVSRVRWGCLIASAVISAVAGILYAGTTGAADPVSGTTFLLPAFAAAFLGSTSIVPGRFNPWGTIVAVYFLVTGITGLSLLGVQTFVQSLFYGGALVLAVTLSQISRRSEAQNMGAGQ